ncbi:methyltransferase domain-containing protein [Gemmatimonas sp.]
MFTPARRRGSETLDDPNADAALSLRSLRDVALANRLFGGKRAVLVELGKLLRANPVGGTLTMLDVGTGLGDIPAAAAQLAAARGVHLRAIGLERAPQLASAAAKQCHHAVAGDAMMLPFADGAVNIVICSQVLHHFDGADAIRLLQECTRVARTAVIVGDLRRSWLAVAGLWLSSFVLGFHPVSRHDGVVSVLRGYTAAELRVLVREATGCHCKVSSGWGFRLSAIWTPSIRHS